MARRTKVERIELVNLEVRDDIQARATIDNATVADYAERMAEGDEFPPVHVFIVDGISGYVLADGFHRVAAAMACEVDAINATVHHGTLADAFEFNVRANQTQTALRFTNADKRHAVLLAFEHYPTRRKKSDRKIAELVGVSNPTVSAMRNELLNFNTSTGGGNDAEEEQADDSQTDDSQADSDSETEAAQSQASSNGQTKTSPQIYGHRHYQVAADQAQHIVAILEQMRHPDSRDFALFSQDGDKQERQVLRGLLTGVMETLIKILAN